MLARPTKQEQKTLQALFAKAAAFEKRGMLAEAARSYRFLLAKRPEPSAYYNYAAVLKKLRDFDAALANYHRAIALKPDYAAAFVNIGSIHMERGEYETALDHYNQAIRHDALIPDAYYNRGVVLQELRRHQDALDDYDRTLALQPRHYLAYLNKSVILYELKRKQEAAHNYTRILGADPNHIDANWNLGILRLSEGDFANGWKHAEWRLRSHADHYQNFLARPFWTGAEDISGKTVFIKWEQGLGDTIQFCRYAPLVKAAGAQVILSVQDPLRRLLATLGENITVIGEAEVPDDYDFHCLLMSLPAAFGTTLQTIPVTTRYLRAGAAETAAWRTRLAVQPGAKIGLVWAGGHRPHITCARRNDANRSLRLGQFSPLLSVAGATFVSLQKGPPAAELGTAQPPAPIIDLTDDLADFAATAALVEALDLIITVDTAVAHLAAALGKPTWILIPHTSCWRWLEDRADSPWYPSVRLFRQDQRGDWAPVIQTVARALAAFQPVARANPRTSTPVPAQTRPDCQ